MNRRLELISWVRRKHEGQFIKETDQPYFEHVLAVANMASGPSTYEIGLCHDLLEKTEVTKFTLESMLKRFGYDTEEAANIKDCVLELTRHFTKENSPLPKKERKELEDERLLTISAHAQTVKYADWYYNADWMMLHDLHHAKDYLKQKIELINGMCDGDALLREKVLGHLNKLLCETLS